MATYENWLNRRKGKYEHDVKYKLDRIKTPEENLIDMLQWLYIRKPILNDLSPTNMTIPPELRPLLGTKSTVAQFKTAYDKYRKSILEAIVTLLTNNRNNLGFTIDELITCIRVSLVDECMTVREAGLRTLRYLIQTESDVATLNTLKLPYLVTRSMDVLLRNEDERAQALRVVRRVIGIVGTEQSSRRYRAAYLDQGLIRCLVAIARASGAPDGSSDRLARPAVATLAELCVLNPDLFITCGGVSAVTRQLAECATPRMAEALCGVLLYTLNEPSYRYSARIDLTCLSSPYSDFHFRPVGTASNRDEREMRFTCSRLSLLCMLRSWPGLLHFCGPRAGGLRALVASLYLPRLEVRQAILDLLYELVGLPQPEWTDEISVALDAVDPSDFQDSWRLNEGFVAAEGTAILPHLSITGPDITEIHLALLLQCFLEAGLLDSLAEVIVTSDTFISVRATVLLGQLLHLIHLLLPSQIFSVTPALPSLMSQAAAGKPQALAAVAALRRLHAMLEARPASYSLFLDHIIQYCSGAFKEKVEDTKSRKEKSNASMVKPKPAPEPAIYKDNSIEFLNESDSENEPKQRHSVGSRADVANRNVSALVKSKSVSSRTSAAVSKVTKAKFFNLFERDSDNLIRSSLVMQNKDGNTWDWEIIRTILKENDSAPLLNLNDSGHKAWAARIINYLKPSSNKYSHSDLTNTGHGHFATRAGCQLIRHLLRHNDVDSQRLLEDFFSDVSRQIEAIKTGLKAHECLFSPQHMCNTMCQMYFLFVGQLCHTHTGLRLLKQTRLYENLLELSTKTHHSCYVKLVISSLDYTLDSYPRDILAKTLTCSIQASRLYATQFLNVLLRASQKSRELVRKKTKLKKSFMQEHYKPSHKEDGDVINGVDMDTWILQMLVGQVKDECKEVVQNALTSLEEAHSVPAYLDKLMSLKDTLGQNCKLDKASDPASLDFSVAGDRGYILWLSLEINASVHSSDAKTTSFLKKHLDYWTKFYNYRYVGLVECGVHEALAVAAEGRSTARARRPARLPVHIHAALASAPAPASASAPRPRAVLHQVLPEHYKILQRKRCTTEQEISDLKASLWALGNTAVTPQGLQLLSQSNGYLEESVPGHIVRLAKSSSVYSVRATAFYVLGLIGSTYDGANLLAGLGWLSVRRTRLDQFPIIQSEIYPQDYDSNLSGPITSPDRRCNAFDQEVSELSDHTDQSTVESLHSDHNKYSNRAMATIEHPDKDQDIVNDKIGFIKEPDKRKSHTLPTQGCSSSHDRPTLSESKTVDILRDCSNYERSVTNRPMENRLLIGRMNSLDHAHEGRMRNTSESSTSGVSSCDSFLAKYAIPDRVLTLSPIPSSSSLHGMKSSSSSQKPRLSETQRRTSTSSFTAQEVASSPPPQMDMIGYTTWTTLNRHRRPHLSESAASGSSDIDDLSWLLSDSNRRTKPFSSLRDRTKQTRERMSKQSLLDYDWMPLQLGETSRAPPTPPPAPAAVPARHTCHPPPAYIGICLPRDINELFTKDEASKEGNTNGEEKPEVVSGRDRVPSYLADSSNASTTPDSHVASHREVTSSVTALSTISAGMSSGNAVSEAATKTTVTIITETPTVNTEDNTPTVSNTKVTGTVTNTNVTNNIINCTSSVASVDVTSATISVTVPVTVISWNTSTVSNTVRPAGITRANSIAAVTSTTTSTGGSIPNTGINKEASETNINNPVDDNRKWRHVASDCLACVRTRPPSAHELREAFFADMDGPLGGRADTRVATNVTELDPSSPRVEILRQVHLMSNPIYSKQTRSTLLSLKQRHPELFRSPCVYSDVSALISRHTYMLFARRFIQELFLDVSFESFQCETAAIVPPVRQ